MVSPPRASCYEPRAPTKPSPSLEPLVIKSAAVVTASRVPQQTSTSGAPKQRSRGTPRSGRAAAAWFSFGPLLAAGLLHANETRADVSSWMTVAGGVASLSRPAESNAVPGALQLDTGLGSSPNSSFVVGGLFRSLTYFDHGTDLAVLLRMSSGGFARGDWGLALDLGPYRRWWGPNTAGGLATLTLGGPWGTQLGISGGYGSGPERTVAVTFGIDWARATAHRESGGSWWTNYVLPLPTRE